MGWDVLIPLIVQVGLPLAESLWTKWSTSAPVTAADWAELRALANQTAVDRAKAQLAAAGIVETDPKYAQIIALVS